MIRLLCVRRGSYSGLVHTRTKSGGGYDGWAAKEPLGSARRCAPAMTTLRNRFNANRFFWLGIIGVLVIVLLLVV
ncbi:hypothetical protein, partial [Nocardia pseudobrasiliensis]|uniref:hypothetical protein n=1 Tax=Nocardia pseudobrasiliensis TaxID=45979 RepID=UPI001B86F156